MSYESQEIPRCYLCGFGIRDNINKDHVLPRDIGATEYQNIAFAHWACNRTKSNYIILPKNYGFGFIPAREHAFQLMNHINSEYRFNQDMYTELELELMLRCKWAWDSNKPLFRLMPWWEWITVGRVVKDEYYAHFGKYIRVKPEYIIVLDMAKHKTKYMYEEQIKALL